MVLLIIGSIVYSLLALLIVYCVVSKKSGKGWLLLAIFIEIVVVFALMTKQPAYFGFTGICGFIPLFLRKNKK